MWIENHLKGHIEWSKGLFGESRLWSEENSDLCFLSVLQGSLKLVVYQKICIMFLHSKISNYQEISIIIKQHGARQKHREESGQRQIWKGWGWSQSLKSRKSWVKRKNWQATCDRSVERSCCVHSTVGCACVCMVRTEVKTWVLTEEFCLAHKQEIIQSCLHFPSFIFKHSNIWKIRIKYCVCFMSFHQVLRFCNFILFYEVLRSKMQGM